MGDFWTTFGVQNGQGGANLPQLCLKFLGAATINIRMFLLPLGLQSRIVKWPIATILIVVATCVVSVFYFSENALYIRHVRQAMVDSKILEARKNLINESCSFKYGEDVCKFLKENLKDTDLFDLKNFAKIYQNEFPETSYMEMRSLMSWLMDDRIDRKLKGTDFEKSSSYQEYVSAREIYLRKSLEKSKEDYVFIRGNAKFMASLKALATHEGWVHLVGNMMIFALFAVFLEQRIGFFGVALLYLIGGLGSNYLQIPFLPMGIRLFGASGAVSAVIGAFAVFFWREKMRCLMSVGFVYNRMILMPAWLYIGLFLVLSDMVGVEGGVAHLAHLTGFGVGFIFAFMQMDLFPLKKGFLFPQERKLYYEAKATEVLEEKMEIFHRIYRLNKESFYSFRALFIYFGKAGCLPAGFTEEDLSFVTEIIRSCFMYSEKNEKQDLALEILAMIPLTWNLSTFDLKIGPDEIMEKAEQFHQAGDLIQTLRFYDMFFAKFAAHPKAQVINSEIMKLFDQVEKIDFEIKVQILDTLLIYADNHPDNQFQTQIRQLIHQVRREEKNAAS